MKKIVILLFLFTNSVAFGQANHRVLSLQECLQKVEENSSLKANTALYNKLLELKVKNSKSDYLPDLQLNATASYQSEVINLDLSLPIGFGEIPLPDKDQYYAYLSVQQILWDGGMSKALQASEKLKTEQKQLSREATLRKAKKQSTEFYFQLLKIRVNREILNKSIEELNKRILSADAAVKSGAATELKLQKLQVEKLKFSQKLNKTEHLETALKKTLIILLNDSTISDFTPEIPVLKLKQQSVENRIELVQLTNVEQITEAQGRLLRAVRMPKIALWAQVGYGKPGLNMLSNTFNPYYIAGVRASWKIWDFKFRNNKQILEIQKDILVNQQSNLSINFRAANAKLIQDIAKYKQLIAGDNKIVALQNTILKKVGNQLDKGIISSTEYLPYLYAKTRYELNLEIHKIDKIKAIADYYLQNGNYDFKSENN